MEEKDLKPYLDQLLDFIYEEPMFTLFARGKITNEEIIQQFFEHIKE